MNSTSQHIALMEALGWTDIQPRTFPGNILENGESTGGTYLMGYEPGTGPLSWSKLPPLTLDLVAQGEMTLTEEQTRKYPYRLADVIAGHDHGILSVPIQVLIRATKEQRLEAFLRVTGRWIP